MTLEYIVGDIFGEAIQRLHDVEGVSWDDIKDVFCDVVDNFAEDEVKDVDSTDDET